MIRLLRAILPRPGAPAPPSRAPAPSAALAAIEAAEFVERDRPPLPGGLDSFRRLALAAESCACRDRVALDELARREATSRPGGRGQGLEWAYDQVFADVDGLQQLGALMRALAPHEPAIRALLAGKAGA